MSDFATVRDTLSWIHTHPDLSVEFQRQAEASLDRLEAEMLDKNRLAVEAQTERDEALRLADSAFGKHRKLIERIDGLLLSRPELADDRFTRQAEVARLREALRYMADYQMTGSERTLHIDFQGKARAALDAGKDTP